MTLPNAHAHDWPGPGAPVLSSCFPQGPFPPGLFSVGIHPWHLRPDTAEADFALVLSAAAAPRCRAIGECGLDRMQGPPLEWQLPWLDRHADAAEALDKPLVIHCVRAFDVLEGWMKRRRPQVPCIVHGFRQKTAVMDGLLRQGALFSFGPAGLRQAKAYGYPLRIPASQLLLETDTLPLDRIEEAFRLAAEAWEVEAEALAFMAQNRFRELFGHWEGD